MQFNLKKDLSINHEYFIYCNKDKIGEIKYFIINGILYISWINIYENYRNKHIASNLIQYLFNSKEVLYIVGQATQNSKGFWKKMIDKYSGKRKDIVYMTNCDSSFILLNPSIHKIKNRNLNTNESFYNFLDYCYQKIG